MSEQLHPNENPNDKLSTGLQVLSFCIPLEGAIIYFNNKSDNPNKAKMACHAALWGIGLGIVFQIIATLAEQEIKKLLPTLYKSNGEICSKLKFSEFNKVYVKLKNKYF